MLFIAFLRSKICLSETTLAMIFFILKFFLYLAFIFYFERMGLKIDDKSKVDTSWCVFFIPIYFFLIFLGFLIILECVAYEKTNTEIFKRLISSSVYYLGFFISMVLYPIKLDGGIKSMNAFVIAGLNTFCSVYLIIHKYYFYKSSN